MGAFDRMMPEIRSLVMPALSDCRLSRTARQMTDEQLMQLGRRQLVFLKSGMRDGEPTFCLYGADGVSLMTFETIEDAAKTICESGFMFVTVH
jgi:hypothetical protein